MTKKKKRIRMAAAVLILAVLAVIYILVLRADFNGEETAEEIEEITVLTIERGDIAEAKIDNSYGTLSFSYDGEAWTCTDNTEFSLNQDSVSALFNRLNSLTAVRDLGGERGDQFFFRYGYYSGRRAYRQLASVFHRQTWRSEGDGILFQKISEASGSCGRKDGIPEEEGEYRSIYKQTHPCGTYPDFCPCRNDKDGFQEIYNQFRRRSIPVESGLCRSRIFLWRTRNYIFYTRRNLK